MMILMGSLLIVGMVASQQLAVPRGEIIPNAMALTFEKYIHCLDYKTDVRAVADRAAFRAAVERGIADCKTLRAELVKEAEADLAADPQYRDRAVRSRVVAAAFDTQDDIQHAMGEDRVLYESK